MTRTALITGITGQDGSYLAELLVAKGYEVHGLVRRTSVHSTGRIDHLVQPNGDALSPVRLHVGDVSDPMGMHRLVRDIRPDEVYHLAAQSNVGASFIAPVPTATVTGLGTLHMLEASRSAEWPIRFYQAGSSEMFGAVRETPQTESTPFAPRSPYAVAKVFAHHLTSQYRDAYGLFACNGLLFNHESPRRGEDFVTRKVTKAVAAIVAGRQRQLSLGNLAARRDWGFAPEYVDAMWRMLQQDQPDDYLIATGETHSVEDLAREAFSVVGLDWRDYVVIDESLRRPTEVEVLTGDARKAEAALGWRPQTRFPALVRLMVAADLRRVGVDPHRYPELA